MFGPLECGFPVDAIYTARVDRRTAPRRSSRRSGWSTPTSRRRRRASASTAPRCGRRTRRSPRASSRRASAPRIARRSCARRSRWRSPAPIPTSSRSGSSGCARSSGGSSFTARSASSTGSFSRTMPAQALPGPRLPRPPAPRAARGDGADGDQPRRLRARPLHRPRAHRLARADPLRLRRGLEAGAPADRAALRLARLGQDDGARAPALPGVPAGLGADRRHRPEGRSQARAAARRRRGDGDDRARARRALPRPARPDADRDRGQPRGPRLLVSDDAAAAPGAAGVADRDPRRGGDRRQGGRADRPARSSTSCARGTPAAQDAGRALEVHLEAGLARLGYGRRGRRAPRRRLGAGRQPADPKPGPAAARAPRARSSRRTSGSARRSCACSPPTRFASAPPTSRRTRCSRSTRPGRCSPTRRAGR